MRATLVLLAALALFPADAAYCWPWDFGNHAPNRAVCDTALAIFTEGTDRERQVLQAYVNYTFAAVNEINTRHGGVDLSARLQARPYAALAGEIAQECSIDISETIYLAVARVYKQEAGAGVPRV